MIEAPSGSTGGRAPSDLAVLSSHARGAPARLLTGCDELDRVLGGGAVPGTAVLVAGEPGIGKSTLLLQVAANRARGGDRVLVVCGEETPEQVRVRAERLGCPDAQIWTTRTTDVERVIAAMKEIDAEFVIADSVQTLSHPEASGSPGSVTQVRESAARLAAAAKESGAVLFLVGQATKDGSVAGPRTLEHLVDVVLWFEGDPQRALRLLRVTKNRFGAAYEVACYEMMGDGLKDVSDPGKMFVAESSSAPGVAVTPIIEGSRAFAVEVQALVGTSQEPSPRRVCSGLEHQRLSLVLAVLDRHARLRLARHDVFCGTVGGFRISEPAADLALGLAIASGFRERAIAPGTAAFGEIGLSGEIRPVAQSARRIKELARLGFSRIIVPAAGEAAAAPGRVQLIPVRNVGEALASIG